MHVPDAAHENASASLKELNAYFETKLLKVADDFKYFLMKGVVLFK